MDALGTLETIERMSREDLAAYYKKQAVAENLVLAIVGDINRLEAKEIADRLLARIPDAPFEAPVQTCTRAPTPQATKTVPPEKLQAHIVLGARGTQFKDKDRYSLEVLAAILSGQGGRLFINLRDEQSLAYTVSAFNREAYEPGAFGVYLATKQENDQKAVAEIRKQLHKIQEETVSKEELDRAKNYLIGAYDLSLQTNQAQAGVLASYERYGLGYEDYWRWPERIQNVTAKQVRKAARKYLCTDCLVEAIVRPEESSPVSPEAVKP